MFHSGVEANSGLPCVTMNRYIVLAALVVLLTVAIPIHARPQSLSISGIVLDQSGATIPDALITLKKGEETRTAQTGAAGTFSFAGVGPGNYEVQAQRDGFKQAATRVVVGNRAPRPIQFKLIYCRSSAGDFGGWRRSTGQHADRTAILTSPHWIATRSKMRPSSIRTTSQQYRGFWIPGLSAQAERR